MGESCSKEQRMQDLVMEEQWSELARSRIPDLAALLNGRWGTEESGNSRAIFCCCIETRDFINRNLSWTCWGMPVIPVFRKREPKDQEFKANMNYMAYSWPV